MKRFIPGMPACAFASVILLAAAPALARQGSGDADNAPDANAAQPSAPSGAALPGVVLERNVFVPVDSAGKPTSNQFIVVERRALTKEGGDAGTSPDDAGATSDVPTRFILVPQEAGDGSNDDDSNAAPR